MDLCRNRMGLLRPFRRRGERTVAERDDAFVVEVQISRVPLQDELFPGCLAVIAAGLRPPARIGLVYCRPGGLLSSPPNGRG